MRYILFILFLFISCSVVAQYPITQKSRRYFTEDEINDLYRETAKEVFAEYRMPASVFDSKYPKLRDKLMAASRKDISQAFKWVESTGEAGINAVRGSEKYEENKALYVKYFKKRIVEAFSNSKELQQYLSFNQSDRITYFKSHVTVKPDGMLLVKEEITIYNGNGSGIDADIPYDDDNAIEKAGGNNDEIKRGIIRSFPTKYVGDYKLNNNTSFKLLNVLVNGEKANYKTGWHDNGISVRIGDADHELEAGNFTYTITYETKYQIKHLDSLDELAWNVTGNGWNFRIDSAACTIQLPAGAAIISNNCFTGAQDSKGNSCEVFYNPKKDSISTTFKTNKPLFPYEGLTVATWWKKGSVSAPSTTEKYIKLLKENQLVFLYPILALLLIFYNTSVWRKVGKDPKRGNIIPTFYPPANLSPAAMGFIVDQKFNNRLVSATMVDLAVRNQLVIEVEKEGILFKSNVYKIEKSEKPTIKVSYYDYGHSGKALIGDTIKRGTYNSTLASLGRNIENDCDQKYKGDKKKPGFFALNNKYMAPGNVFTVLLFFYLLFGVFIVTEVAQYNPHQLIYTGCGLVLCIVIQCFFYGIMPAYTDTGRKVLDEIEGFRMYLKAADEQRINAMNPPEKSLELYERYMPFAIALECENEWGEQFKNIIDQATMDGSAAGTYSSSMYSNSFHSSDFTSSFISGFSGSISSASTPPSSSGGSGGSSFSSGGGSSGGGGGGGGGGGW